MLCPWAFSNEIIELLIGTGDVYIEGLSRRQFNLTLFLNHVFLAVDQS